MGQKEVWQAWSPSPRLTLSSPFPHPEPVNQIWDTDAYFAATLLLSFVHKLLENTQKYALHFIQNPKSLAAQLIIL